MNDEVRRAGTEAPFSARGRRRRGGPLDLGPPDDETPAPERSPAVATPGGCALATAAFVIAFVALLFGLAERLDGPWWPALSLVGAAGAAIALSTHRPLRPRSLLTALIGVVLVGIALLPLGPRHWSTPLPFHAAMLDAQARQVAQAIAAGDADRIGRLVDGVADRISQRDAFDRPLIEGSDDLDLVEALLAAGFDPDLRNARGQTPTMTALEPRRLELLLAAGADPNARDPLGRTPLVYAASGDPERVRLLLDAGADAEARDDLGRWTADAFSRQSAAWDLLETTLGRPPRRSPAEAPPPLGTTDWLVERDLTATSDQLVSSTSWRPERFGFGEVATLVVRIANAGDQERLDALEVSLGRGVLFVGASHGGRIALPDVAPIERAIRWPNTLLPPRSIGEVEIDVVLDPRDRGEVDATVQVSPLRADEAIQLDVPPPLFVDASTDDPATGSDATWRCTALFGLLAALAAGLLVAFALARRRLPTEHRARRTLLVALLAVSGVALGLVAVSLATSAAQPWTSTEPTTCEVLDRRARLSSFNPASSASTASGRPSRRQTLRSDPVLALRVEGGRIASGFASDAADATMRDLEAFTIGDEVTCWIDPNRPHRAVVTRGLGVISLLLMLAIAGAGLGLLALALVLARR
ncbi:MAG: ankyrin repeat domain-containing protein [Acidobacteriota bacterium]